MKDEIIVKVQRMFPNCQKYTKCCDEAWDKKLEHHINMPIKVDYTLLTEKDIISPPKDFREPRDWRTDAISDRGNQID